MRQQLAPVVMGVLLVLAGCVGGLGGTTTAPGGTTTTAPDGTSAQRTGSMAFYISDQQNAISDFAHLNVTVTKIGFRRVDGAADEETTTTGNETTTGNTTTPANTTTTTTTGNATTANTTTVDTTTTAADDDHEDDEHEADDGDAKWITRDVEDVTIDLTEYQGANATHIGNVSLPNGTYTKTFVYVSEVNGTLENGEHVNVKLPSNKLHVNGEFTVGDGEHVDYVFDITVFEAGKSGKYILKPVVSESGTDKPIEVKDRERDREEHEGDHGQQEHEDREHQSDESALEADFSGNVTAGGNATLTVTRNDSAVANATVTVDGEEVGTTAADGTLTFTVPDAKQLRVRVRADGATTSLTVRLDAGENGDDRSDDRNDD